MSESIQIRIHGEASLPTLVYLPGTHGDWTLVSSFRAAIAGKVRFVEFTYPRTTTWSLEDYAGAIEESLLANGIDGGWLLGESFGSQPAWQIVKHFLEQACSGDESKPTGNLSMNGPLSLPSPPPKAGERAAEGRERGLRFGNRKP